MQFHEAIKDIKADLEALHRKVEALFGHVVTFGQEAAARDVEPAAEQPAGGATKDTSTSKK